MNRKKMPVEQRAKQFAPFKSVGGLDEALKKAEEEHRREMEANSLVHVAGDIDIDGPDGSVTDII